jgi:hypothetical protein
VYKYLQLSRIDITKKGATHLFFVTIKIPAQGDFPVLKEWFLSKKAIGKRPRERKKTAAFDIHYLRAHFAWVDGAKSCPTP